MQASFNLVDFEIVKAFYKLQFNIIQIIFKEVDTKTLTVLGIYKCQFATYTFDKTSNLDL